MQHRRLSVLRPSSWPCNGAEVSPRRQLRNGIPPPLGVRHVPGFPSLGHRPAGLETREVHGVDIVPEFPPGASLARTWPCWRRADASWNSASATRTEARDWYCDRSRETFPSSPSISTDSGPRGRALAGGPLGRRACQVESASSTRCRPVLPCRAGAGRLRHIARSRHIGQVFLSMSDRVWTSIALVRRSVTLFCADGSYLITGGLGGAD